MVSNGKAMAVFTTDSKTYTHIYMGQYAVTNSEAPQLYDPESGTCGSYVYPFVNQKVTVPVKLNTEMDFSGRTVAMSKTNWVSYTYKITLTEPAEKPSEDSGESDTGKLEDGTYRFDFDKNENAVELAEGYVMFRVTACTLTVKDGKMTAVMTLSGTGYDYLYPGTKEEALAADLSDCARFVKDNNGKYTYTIPVRALDEVVVIAGRSARYAAEGAAQPWYDKGLIFHSDALEKVADAETGDSQSGENTGTNFGDSGDGNNSGTSSNTGKDSNSGKTDSGKTSSGNSGTKNGGSSNGGGSKGAGSGGTGYAANTNGSTGAVNSSTGLEDGEYTPDSFSWSGGTGKLSISCIKITVSNGKTYAQIVFSSGKITYVKAGGGQFAPISQNADTTTFEIPVQLNANNKILACTTAMSQPHEVEYTLYIGLEAAKTAALGDTSGISASSAGGGAVSSRGSGSTAANGSAVELLEEAPKVAGLDYEGTSENEYANYFRLHYYKDGFRVLEISLSDEETPDWDAQGETGNTDANAEKEEPVDDTAAADNVADADEGSFVEQKSLYEGEVLRYLIVPEDGELPAGIDKEMIIVQLPVEKAYVDSNTALKMLDKLGAVDRISMVGVTGQECEVDSVVRAMADGNVQSIGHYDETSIYRALVTSGTKLAIVHSDILQAEAGAEDSTDETAEDSSDETVEGSVQEIGDGMALLKIPMIVDRAQDETEELAKYEWLKVYGAIFDCEKEAGEAFRAAEEALKK